jgi:hypothetical protein
MLPRKMLPRTTWTMILWTMLLLIRVMYQLVWVMTGIKESKIPAKPTPPAKTEKSKVEDIEKPTVNSDKITESPLSKKAAKSPEAYNPVTSKPEKPHDALPPICKQ